MAVPFWYDRPGFEGYLGNVSLVKLCLGQDIAAACDRGLYLEGLVGRLGGLRNNCSVDHCPLSPKR